MTAHLLTIMVLLVTAMSRLALSAEPEADVPGKAEYRFYCYQCHGYSGDANTLASSYLDPDPRNFTTQNDATLSVGQMIDAVTNGREGTAMVSFSSVLDERQISDVVDYIRKSFMSGSPLKEKYHSVENGWINHERYAGAFPFIQGSLSIDTPWEDLSEDQRRGRRLYESSCVSCHDQPNSESGEAIWELRSVSYPREHYSHRLDPADFVSAASPYARHDVPVEPANMTPQQARGMKLYLDNCEFCHAADGTGSNWIGSFMDPRPRNFNAADFFLLNAPESLRELVKAGIKDSSMPAWRSVLSDDEIDDIIRYMQAAFAVDN